ncbi:MAG: type II toxin-antitoxin system BrnA family antitoxin [Chloroflexota bacterium]
MKASEFEKKFDDGESVIEDLDLSRARRLGEEQKRINVDFPVWMIQALDREARRMGVTRQSVIKMWLAERLQQQG